MRVWRLALLVACSLLCVPSDGSVAARGRLVRWMEDHGTKGLSNVHIVSNSSSSVLHSSKTILKGETVLEIPCSLCVNVLKPEGDLRDFFQHPVIPDTMKLGVAFAVWKRYGSAELQPFIDTFPEELSPIWWKTPPGIVAALDGSILQELIEFTASEVVNLHADVVKLGDAKIASLTLDEVAWGVALAKDWGDVTPVCPIASLLKPSLSGNVQVIAGESTVRLEATTIILPEDQLEFSTTLGSPELLIRHGIYLENNKNDLISVDIPLEENDIWAPVRSGVLSKLSLPARSGFRPTWDPAMAAKLRIYFMSVEELNFWNSFDILNTPVSLENELKCLRKIIDTAESFLSLFPSSLEEDRRLLADGSSDLPAWVFQWRYREKRLYANAIKDAEQKWVHFLYNGFVNPYRMKNSIMTGQRLDDSVLKGSARLQEALLDE